MPLLFLQRTRAEPPRSAPAHWLEVDAKLMPNPGRNAGFYRPYRLIIHFECAAGCFDPTFTQWRSTIAALQIDIS